MKNFFGYYDNGTFRVGCHGGTVYIYDQDNTELARFKELPYAYKAAFMPGKNIIAVKSTAGYLGFYDLDSLQIIKKITVTTIGAQDEGFSFSPDGKLFYNIEKPLTSIYTELGIYETENFTKIKKLFSGNRIMFMRNIEFDIDPEACFIIGFMRDRENGVYNNGFVGILDEKNECISHSRQLTPMAYQLTSAYKDWEQSGFTKRAAQLGHLMEYLKNITHTSLKEAYYHKNNIAPF